LKDVHFSSGQELESKFQELKIKLLQQSLNVYRDMCK